MPLPVAAALGMAAIPSVINGISTLFTNKSNQDNYRLAQERANEFARQERVQSQAYNSLENQFAQMARVGMNPNLLQGQMFQASSPVSNQPVTPPQNVAPQLPVESFGQTLLERSQSKNLDQQTLSSQSLLSGAQALQYAEFMERLSNVHLTQKQSDYLSKQMFSIDESVKQIREQVKLFSEQWAAQKLQNDVNSKWLPRRAEQEFRNLVQEYATSKALANMYHSQAKNFMALAYGQELNNKFFHDTYRPRVQLFQYDAKGRRLNLSIQQTASDKLKFEFGQLKTYDDWRQMLNLGNSAINVIHGLQNINPVERMMDRGFSLLGGSISNNSPSVQPLPNSYGSGGFE